MDPIFAYQDLFNEAYVDASDINTSSITVSDLTVTSTLDTTGVTFTGFPTDEVSLTFSSNVASIKASGVTTAKIANLNVTDAKIVSVSASKITGAFGPTSVANITLTDASNQIIFGGTAPTTTISCPVAGSNRVYTINDAGANDTFCMLAAPQTISGKLLTTTSSIVDSGDNNKRLSYNLAGKTTGTTSSLVFAGGAQTITFVGGSSYVLLGDTLSQTVSSKLLKTSCSFADTADTTKTVAVSISGKTTGTATTLAFTGGAQTVTYPTGTYTLLSPSNVAVVSNKSIDSTCAFVDSSDNTKIMIIDTSGKTFGTQSILAFGGGNQIVNVPINDVDLVGADTVQTISNKNINATCVLCDTADVTKNVIWDMSGKTTGTSTQLAITGGTYTITFPSSGSYTVASLATTQTFANKSIDSTCAIIDATDATKKLVFDNSGMTTINTVTIKCTGVTRNISLPSATCTLAGITTTDALTNKTVAFTNSLGGSSATLTQYEENASFTTTWAFGGTNSASQTIKIVMVGKVVTLVFSSDVTATVSGVTADISNNTALLARWCPVTTLYFPATVKNSGTVQFGQILVTSGGTIRWESTAAAAVWGTGAASTLYATSVTYNVL